MIDEYTKLSDVYNPADRVAACPDPDSTTLTRIEVNFAIPVEMTQDQQRRLVMIIDEITDSPWNEPSEGVHWLSCVGAKPNWSRTDAAMFGIEASPGAPSSGEPTFDNSVFHVETRARAFVGPGERARKVANRADAKPPRPAHDAVLEALRAVAHFWGKDPEAFGDAATVTSLAGKFARVADKCRKALAIAEAEAMRSDTTTERDAYLNSLSDEIDQQHREKVVLRNRLEGLTDRLNRVNEITGILDAACRRMVEALSIHHMGGKEPFPGDERYGEALGGLYAAIEKAAGLR